MIRVFSKPNCPYCDMAKAWLNKNSIAFEEVNVMTDNKYKIFLVEKGLRTVPQIFNDEELLVEGGWTGLQKTDPDTLRSI